MCTMLCYQLFNYCHQNFYTSSIQQNQKSPKGDAKYSQMKIPGLWYTTTIALYSGELLNTNI